MRTLRAFPAFDGFRGIGVSAVVLAHLPRVLDAPIYNAVWSLDQATRFGYICLDVFFVISGFFITRLLLAEKVSSGKISLTNFYYRRTMRIFPVYYLSLIVCFLCFRIEREPSIALLSYTFNIYHPFHPAPNPLEHTWSLSVEEQFYLVWPLLLTLVPMRLGRLITGRILPAVAVASGLAIGLWLWNADPQTAGDAVYMAPTTRMLSLSLGAWLAFRELEERPIGGRTALALLVGAVILLVGDRIARGAGLIPSQALYWTIALVSYSMISVAVASTVIFDGGRAHRWLTAVLSVSLFRGLGNMSYALYVFHLPVLYAFGLNDAVVRGGEVPALRVVEATALILAMGIVSYIALERPLMRLRNRGRGKSTPATTGRAARLAEAAGGAGH